MIILGLTGSIGMGKSTTANIFKKAGISVHDADAVVHKLYNDKAVLPVGSEFPDAVVNGKIDRKKLSQSVINDPGSMKKLEAIIHPLVAKEREKFLAQANEQNSDLVVLDIPLLFETGSDKYCDLILVVTAPYQVQKKRVLERDNMSEKKFNAILSKQMPDEEKQKRADYVLDTSKGIENATKEVHEIIKIIKLSNKQKAS